VRVLAGDAGGTSTRLAIFDGHESGAASSTPGSSASGLAPSLVATETYRSADYRSFHEVVAAFLGTNPTGPGPERACFAIAGPVFEGRSRTTNLPWVLDERELERALGLQRVRLINDFQAQALAVLELGPQDFVEIVPGAPVARAPIAVLGAGTGLGEAFLHFIGEQYEVVSSEGGHADFAPVDDRQIELLRWLRAKLSGRVSYERILSGKGLLNCYEFLREREPARERADVREAMARPGEDPSAVVSRFGLQRACGLCDEALDIFCEVYAQEAGNLILKVLASGGVYLAGGIAAKILDRLRAGPFQRRYAEKGRLSALVRAVPVRVVTLPHAGLVGAATAALRSG
jgi:glucokinase